jgi:hypothetical protein
MNCKGFGWKLLCRNEGETEKTMETSASPLRHLATSRKFAGSILDDNDFSSIYLTLSAALGPEVQSVTNRNEYQKQKNNVSGE